MKALFFHGGPGFNSNPERQLLVQPARARGVQVETWDEPSEQRPEGPSFHADDAFDAWVKSAEHFLLAHADGPLTVIGHSYGSHAVSHLCARHPDAIERAILVAPALDQKGVERRMLHLARDEFERLGDPSAGEVDEVLAAFTGDYDATWLRGLDLILQNPGFFARYWQDAEIMAAYFQAFEDPGYGMDLTSYHAVRATHRWVDQEGTSVPVVAVFGEHDPLMDQAAESDILSRHFVETRSVCFERSGHYPHLEEMPRFLDLLLDGMG